MSRKELHNVECSPKQRNGDIDIIKFIASIMIMLAHLSLFKVEDESIPFESATVFNILFFTITGYFTAKHFSKSREEYGKNPAQEALLYTLKKLKTPFLYALITAICYYGYKLVMLFVVGTADIYSIVYYIIDSLEWFLYDIMFMRAIGYLDTAYGTLWYVSALLFVLPLVCVLLMSRYRDYYLYLGSWSIPLVYWGIVKFNGIYEAPHRMLYAFAAISGGVMVFVISEYINTTFCQIKKSTKKCLCAAQWFALLFIMALSRVNSGNIFLILILFWIIVILSNFKLGLHFVSTPIIRFLGEKLSLAIYITHFLVFRVLNDFLETGHTVKGRVISVIISFCFSIIVIMIACLIQTRLKRRKILGELSVVDR